MTSILLRRQDGLAKVLPNVCALSGGVYEKNGVSYRCQYTLPSYNGDGHDLLVCEQDVDDITQKEPFVRSLPGILGHELFFGDLLLVHRGADGDMAPFTLDDARAFFEGTHVQWCMRNIRDVGQNEETFEEDDEDDDDDDDEDDEDEETVRSEDEETILGNEESDDDEEESDDETVH